MIAALSAEDCGNPRGKLNHIVWLSECSCSKRWQSEAEPLVQEQMIIGVDKIMVLLWSTLSTELQRWEKYACFGFIAEYPIGGAPKVGEACMLCTHG
jgi:hypothetical protein